MKLHFGEMWTNCGLLTNYALRVQLRGLSFRCRCSDNEEWCQIIKIWISIQNIWCLPGQRRCTSQSRMTPRGGSGTDRGHSGCSRLCWQTTRSLLLRVLRCDTQWSPAREQITNQPELPGWRTETWWLFSLLVLSCCISIFLSKSLHHQGICMSVWGMPLSVPCLSGRGWWSESVLSGATAGQPVTLHPGWTASHWLTLEPEPDSRSSPPTRCHRPGPQ